MKANGLKQWVIAMRKHLSVYNFGNEENMYLSTMVDEVDQVSKKLAVCENPAKVLVVVYPDGSNPGAAARAGTIPVTVVIVDHRPQVECKLRVDTVSPMAVFTEFNEAVSDEAAPYLSNVQTVKQLAVL